MKLNLRKTILRPIKYNIFYFSNTFGINKQKIKTLNKLYGINPNIIKFFLKQKKFLNITKEFNNNFYGKILKIKLSKLFKFFLKIKIYRGIRHQRQLPSRGQRTHTNAKTKRHFFF